MDAEAEIEARWKSLVSCADGDCLDEWERKVLLPEEYGMTKDGLIFPPKPFIRSTERSFGRKWEGEMEKIAERWLSGASDDAVREMANELRRRKRLEFHKSAISFGVSEGKAKSLLS